MDYNKRIQNEKKKIRKQYKERKYFLDILRIFAACAVVMLHTVTGIMDITNMEQYPLERKFFLVIMDLVTWSVPIFIMISGYLFLQSDKKISFGKMLIKYCRRIVFALVLFGVPYAWIEQIVVEKTFQINMIGKGFLMVLTGQSWSHMWYLYLILVLYLVTPALKWILQRIPHIVIYLIQIVLFTGASVFPYLNRLEIGYKLPCLPDDSIYFFYYICGYLFTKMKQKNKVGQSEVFKIQMAEYLPKNNQQNSETNLQKHFPENMLGKYIAVIVMILLAVGMTLSRITGNYNVRMAYNYPFTVIFAILLFYFFKESEKKHTIKNPTFWKKAGALSFCIYLIHPIFINVFYKFLHITPLNYPIGISLPIFFLVIFILSVMVSGIMYKIPFLKKYVL